LQIYEALIGNWHFNVVNLNEATKQKLIRDVKRLSDLADIGHNLTDYHEKNKVYPNLQGGSYLKSLSVSAWPSLQATLGNDLGKGMPIDPKNTFVIGNDIDSCHVPQYDRNTCWWGDKILYALDGGRFTCQAGSSVYMYQFAPNASTPPDPTMDGVNLYAQLEYSGWAGTGTTYNPCSRTQNGSACSCFNYQLPITP
jgi:hypothetical protein